MKLFDYLQLSRKQQGTVKVSGEAYEWFTTLYSGDLTEEEFEQYLLWAEKNPAQDAQLKHLETIWKKIAKPASAAIETTRDAENIELPLSGYPGWPHQSSATTQSRFRWLSSPNRLPAVGYAFVLIAFAGIISFFIAKNGENLFRQDVIFQTSRAETTNINLPDGSIANLNVLSRIVVHYTDDERQIELIEGEASFTVMHDSERPFVVSSEANEVIALGTEFNTKVENGNNLIVTLVEGRIQLSHTNQNNEQESTILDQPGLQAIMNSASAGSLQRAAGANPIRIVRAELSTVLSWREGKLVFSGESLEEAINIINRHSTHNIRLQAPGLTEMPVFGVFNSGDREGFLSAVELSYPLKQYDAGNNLTILGTR